jgi:hypothetical protein
MIIMLSWHNERLTKYFRSFLPTVKKKKRREEKTIPWDRRKNVQITDNSNYCQNRTNLQNHDLDIIINLHLNPHQCYTGIYHHHLTHVSITYFFWLKNKKILIIWSKRFFFGGVSHRVWQQVVLCNFIKGFDWLIVGVYRHFQQYFSYIMATSFSYGGSRSTRWEPRTMGKQLLNFITCGCESSAPFFGIYKAEREAT